MLELKCYYCKRFIDTYNIGHIGNTYMYCSLCINKYIGIQRELFGSKIRLKKSIREVPAPPIPLQSYAWDGTFIIK